MGCCAVEAHGMLYYGGTWDAALWGHLGCCAVEAGGMGGKVVGKVVLSRFAGGGIGLSACRGVMRCMMASHEPCQACFAQHSSQGLGGITFCMRSSG
eukprot:316026-Pelagomonas_calceolata.AAC.1